MVTVAPLGPEVGVNEVMVGLAGRYTKPGSRSSAARRSHTNNALMMSSRSITALISLGDVTVKRKLFCLQSLPEMHSLDLELVIITVVPESGSNRAE